MRKDDVIQGGGGLPKMTVDDGGGRGGLKSAKIG